ncbi:MAG: AI-2E family transporter [Oscillospiraceae bacterium]|nr:AI-2E family transporter [Oscillospiraceae bacterium]
MMDDLITARNIGKVLMIAIGSVLLAAVLLFMLPFVLPFIISFLLSCVLEPFIRSLTSRLKISRFVAATAVTVVFLLSATAFLTFFLLMFVRDFFALLGTFPDTLQRWFSTTVDFINANSDAYLSLPKEITSGIDQIVSNFAALSLDVSTASINAVIGFIMSIPNIMLIFFTAIISLFFFAYDRERILAAIKARMGEGPYGKAERAVRLYVSPTVGHVRRRLLFALILAALMFAGFTLAGIPFPLTLSLLIAAIDLIPLIGAGTALIPAAAYYAITSSYFPMAVLIALYAAIILLRVLLLSRRVSARPFNPLLILVSIYLMQSVIGLWGILVGPAVVMVGTVFLRGRKLMDMMRLLE